MTSSIQVIILRILKSTLFLTVVATFIGTMFGAFFGSLSTYVLAYDPGFYFSDYPLIMHTEINYSNNRDYSITIHDECPTWMSPFKRYDYPIRLKHGDLPHGLDLEFFLGKGKNPKESDTWIFNLRISTTESIKQGTYPIKITAIGGDGKQITTEIDIAVTTKDAPKE